MSELSRDDVLAVIGRRLSDAVIAELIATGVTKTELEAARDRALRDSRAPDPGPGLEPGRLSNAVQILERLHGGGIIGEGGSTLE
jgi:hypothetical protein